MKNIHGYQTDTQDRGDRLPMAPMMASGGQQRVISTPGFYSALGEAFMMPLRGAGLRWLLLLGVATIVGMFALVGARFLFLVGLIVPFLVFAALLTLNARFFFATFTAMAYLEDEPVAPSWEELRGQLLLPGFVLMGWVITAYLPLYWWLSNKGAAIRSGGVSVVIAFLLIFLPYILWPAALTRMTSGSVVDMWHVPSILKGIFQAPMKYAVVIGFATVAGLLPLVGAWLLGKTQMGMVSRTASMFLSSMAWAYCHGVMGAMMGALVVEHPEVLPESARMEE